MDAPSLNTLGENAMAIQRRVLFATTDTELAGSFERICGVHMQNEMQEIEANEALCRNNDW